MIDFIEKAVVSGVRQYSFVAIGRATTSRKNFMKFLKKAYFSNFLPIVLSKLLQTYKRFWFCIVRGDGSYAMCLPYFGFHCRNVDVAEVVEENWENTNISLCDCFKCYILWNANWVRSSDSSWNWCVVFAHSIKEAESGQQLGMS